DVDPLTVAAVNGSGANVGVAINGTYGQLTLNSNGTYSYTLFTAAQNLSAFNAIQALDDSETVTDNFTYTASDGAASNGSTLQITIFGTNDAPNVQDTCVWMSSDPAQQTASTPSYPNGYPLLVAVPTDIDVENITVTSDAPVPTGVFYFNGSSYVALTAGRVLYNPNGGINLLDDLVYIPTATVNDTVTKTLSLSVSDGTATVNQTVTIHEVPPTRLPSQTAQIGDGVSPLTSGNDQTTPLVLTQAFVDGINANPGAAVIVVKTDFQNTPVVVPVPLAEQNPTAFGAADAGSQREMEVQVEVVIGTNHFVIVQDDLTAATFEQSWFFDAASGLMKATVDYSHIFLLDGSGNATATTLAAFLTANPATAGDTWTVLYTDN